MTNTEQPTETSRLVFATGVSDEDRERGEQVDVTAWSDGSVGIGVEYVEEQTRTSTYAEGAVAREIAYGILAGVQPSRDVRIEHAEDDAWGLVVASASWDNRVYLANPDGEDRDSLRAVALERPAVGTLYLDPATGDVYRLRGWYSRIVGAPEASYSTLGPDGMSSSARALPDGSIPVWSPAPIVGEV